MVRERIQSLRAENGYSQATLAKRLGLTRAAINAWEIGYSIPSTPYVVEMSKLFKVSAGYILGLEEKERIDISNLKPDQKNTVTSLVEQYERCNAIIDAAGITSMDDKEIQEILVTLRSASDGRGDQ